MSDLKGPYGRSAVLDPGPSPAYFLPKAHPSPFLRSPIALAPETAVTGEETDTRETARTTDQVLKSVDNRDLSDTITEMPDPDSPLKSSFSEPQQRRLRPATSPSDFLQTGPYAQPVLKKATTPWLDDGQVVQRVARYAEGQKIEATRLSEFPQMVDPARSGEEASPPEQTQRAEPTGAPEEALQADNSRLAEEARVREEDRIAEEARVLESHRIAEEAKSLHQARLAEEARLREEARQREEARLAEQARKLERTWDLEERQQLQLKRQLIEAQQREELRQLQEKTRRKTRPQPFDRNLGAWLAGAGPGDLRECGESERRKVCAVGYTVLVPTIFALMAAAYAVGTLTPNPVVITLVAIAWATIILLVDRAIIATYSPFMKIGSKIGVITLRLCVAVLMGLTISHPITLLLFRDTITTEIEAERDLEIEAIRKTFAGQKDAVEIRLTALQAEIDKQRKLYDESFEAKFVKASDTLAEAAVSGTLNAEEQATLNLRTEEAAKGYRQELVDLATRIKAEEDQKSALQSELNDWQRQFEAEINGQRSGVSGVGPRARSIQTDQIEWRRADLQRMTDELRKLSTRRTEIETAIAASGDNIRREIERAAAERAAQIQREKQRVAGLQQQAQEQQMSNFLSKSEQVRSQIQSVIDSGLADLTRLRGELETLSTQEKERVEALRSNPRQDMLSQTLALHHLFEDPKKGGHFALMAYLVLAGLFLAIDTMPILVKFTSKKGEYEIRRERALVESEGDGVLASLPANLKVLDPTEAEELHLLVVDYYKQDQQRKLYLKEKEAIDAKADRDAASRLKGLELADRERLQELGLTDRELKLALAKKDAEIQKLELAAKEAEANEARAKAHLSKLHLENVQNDSKGLLKHELHEAQVARGRERFAKQDLAETADLPLPITRPSAEPAS